MWLCSATQSDSKPLPSACTASSVIEMAYSVGKKAIPNFMVAQYGASRVPAGTGGSSRVELRQAVGQLRERPHSQRGPLRAWPVRLDDAPRATPHVHGGHARGERREHVVVDPVADVRDRRRREPRPLAHPAEERGIRLLDALLPREQQPLDREAGAL